MKGRTFAAAVLVWSSISLLAGSSAADEPLDPLVPTAIAEIGTGVVIGAAGTMILIDANTGPERCGRIAGCVDAVPDVGADLDGRYVTGAGIGLAAAGGLTWALVASDPLDPGEHRDSSSGTVAGSILVALGASGLGSIIAGSTSAQHETGWNLLIGAAVLPSLAVGIPLLATSLDGETREEAAAEEAEDVAVERALAGGAPTEMASPGMFAAGVTLTSIGGLAALGGTGLALASGGSPGGGYGALFGGAIAGGGVLFLGAGIPLTVVGSRKVPERTRADALPEVTVGIGSLAMTGRF